MEEKVIQLPAIKETTSDFDRMESRIKKIFKLVLYLPLLKELELNHDTISNAYVNKSDLALKKALETGRITVSRGTFKGRFDAKTTIALRKVGAKWDKKSGTFKLATSDQPMEIREAVSVANVRYQERVARIDKRLSKISPAEITGKIKTKDLFESVLSKTDKQIKASTKQLGVYPQLSPKEQSRIAEEWQNNMDLWINNFAEKEITQLRKDIAANVASGNRYESMVKTIQKSYGVTANKAKFLARQETSLLMAKFKETRYTNIGVHEYKWKCVAGSVNHPVRPMHKVLDGTIHRWDNPPKTADDPVRYNNPGQDYNCRCSAIPIVKFKKFK